MTIMSESNNVNNDENRSSTPPPPPPPPPAPISAHASSSSSSERGMASTLLHTGPRSLTPDPIPPNGKEGGPTAATATRTRSHVEFSADLFNHRFRQQYNANAKTPPPPPPFSPSMPPAMSKCDYYFSQPYYPYYYRQYYLNNFGVGIGGKYRLAPSMNAGGGGGRPVAPPYSSSSFTTLPSHQFNRIAPVSAGHKHQKTNRRKSSATNKQQQQSNKRILMNGGELNGVSTVMPAVPRSNRKFMMAMKSNGKDNKNREPDHHNNHLSGYSSLFLCTDDEDLNGPHHRQTAFELIEDDEPKVNGSAKKLLLTNSNGSNGAAVSVNGMILNRSDSCLNGENVNSCAISIPGHRHHHHPHNIHHNHHQLFGSETNSSVNSSTTINTNSTCSRSKPKSLRMILCSYVLTILVIFIISGISFACGLLAAQHFNKILFCDFSNSSTSNSELSFVSSNRSPSTRNQRMSRNHKFSPNNVSPLNSTKIEFDVSTISTTNATKEDSAMKDSNNTKVITMGDSPINQTTSTMAPYAKRSWKDDRGSLIDLRTTTTSTSTTTTTIAPTTIGSSILVKGEVSTREPEISTLNPNASTYPEVISTTEGNFLSSMIDQYNQALKETVQQTSSEAQFLIPLLNTSNNGDPILDILESNQTEIMISTTSAPDSVDGNDEMMTTIQPIGDKVILEDNSTTTTTTTTDSSRSNPTTLPSSVELQSKTVDDPNLTDFDSNFDSSLLNQTEMYATNNIADVSDLTSTMSNVSSEMTTEEPDLSAANSTSDQLELDLNLDMTTEGTNGTNSSQTDNFDLTGKTSDLDYENFTLELNNLTTEIYKISDAASKEPSVQQCLDNQFKCPNSNSTECLPKLRLCDGIVDCPLDKFDETNCSATDCLLNFRCGSKSISLRISNETDASINSNDSLINQTTIFGAEPPQNLAQCIPIANKCDGIWDCADGSDELECFFSKCEPGKVLCRDNSACITGKQACDGVYNCRDRSDEAGCVDRSSCEAAGRFSCDDNALCIGKSLVCDGIPDCDNGADEKDCVTGETCRISDSKFFCQQSSECIDAAKRCDGNVDCLDYSDEDRCLESDTDDFVYAYNGRLNQWALLCVDEDFDQNGADLICSKMGMDLSRKFSKVLIIRLLANSTWAKANALSMDPSHNESIDVPVKQALNYSSLTFTTTCPHMFAVKIECEQLRCAARNFDPSSPEAAEPKPIMIVDRANRTKNGKEDFSHKCLAFTLSPKWLLTSGQCLKNLISEAGNNIMIEVNEKTLPVENIRFHPKFSIFRTRRFPDYDLALVESQNLLPTLNHSICLPTTKLDPAITCFIGNYRNGDTPFEVLESSFCNSTQHYSGSITDRHICASSQEDGLKNVCLPPFLPLICLSSKSLWYIAGFSSYQYGCDSLTGSKILPRHFLHPTLFSNLYAMKPFIDQTLSTSTYRKNRSEISNGDPLTVSEMMDLRASFVVAGSDEDVQILDSPKPIETLAGRTDFDAEGDPKAQNQSMEINQSNQTFSALLPATVLMENSTVLPTLSELTTVVVQSLTQGETVEPPPVEDEDSDLKDTLANLSALALDFNETSIEMNNTTSSEEDDNQSMDREINTTSLPATTVTESTISSTLGPTVAEPELMNKEDHEEELSDPKSMNITVTEDVLPKNSSEASVFLNSTEPTILDTTINGTVESNRTMDHKISLLYNNDNSEENETEQV